MSTAQTSSYLPYLASAAAGISMLWPFVPEKDAISRKVSELMTGKLSQVLLVGAGIGVAVANQFYGGTASSIALSIIALSTSLYLNKQLSNTSSIQNLQRIIGGHDDQAKLLKTKQRVLELITSCEKTIDDRKKDIERYKKYSGSLDIYSDSSNIGIKGLYDRIVHNPNVTRIINRVEHDYQETVLGYQQVRDLPFGHLPSAFPTSSPQQPVYSQPHSFVNVKHMTDKDLAALIAKELKKEKFCGFSTNNIISPTWRKRGIIYFFNKLMSHYQIPFTDRRDRIFNLLPLDLVN